MKIQKDDEVIDNSKISKIDLQPSNPIAKCSFASISVSLKIFNEQGLEALVVDNLPTKG